MGVGGLQGDRSGVVDGRRDASIGQFALKPAAIDLAVQQDDEQVPGMAARRRQAGELNVGRIREKFAIEPCVTGTGRVPRVEMAQLDVQHGPLNAFHPRVVANFDVIVPTVLGVVAQPADAGRQAFVTGDDRAGLSKSTQIFSGIETEAADPAERPQPFLTELVRAWAASSMRTRLWDSAIWVSRSISQARPYKWTGRMARVRGVRARSIRSGSRL